jgi:FKBP-type peptidyl-prolyl cis-trans isomerase
MSYGIGYQSGKRFLREIQMNGVDIDIPSMMEGLQDAFASKPSRLPESQMQASLEAAQRQAEATQQNRMKEAQAQRAQQAEKNKTEGEAFLAANAQREGVKVTESGLQYEVIHQGDGPRPQPTDQVTVNYRGTLIDGTEFDSSAKHGKPAQFRLDRVIKGWTEGVGLMSVGSKYKFFIPSDLAYGLMAPPQIGPNATLLFEVELLDIAHEAPAPGAASAPSAGAASKPAK